MNTIVTSREALLQASQAIAIESGLQALHIRALAQRCGVSVGSVYNYFPSKADLLAATVEAVWESVFHTAEQCQRPAGFRPCVAWLFERIRHGTAEYPAFFNLHSLAFAAGDRPKGRQVMENAFSHMKRGLAQALEEDADVRPGAFSGALTREALVAFTFSNLLALSAEDRSDCGLLMALISRAIY